MCLAPDLVFYGRGKSAEVVVEEDRQHVSSEFTRPAVWAGGSVRDGSEDVKE